MQRVTLGRTGLPVSPIAFGTWQLGGDWGAFEEQTAIAAIRAAYDRGINFFDTAQAYGFGASERILGKALHDVRDSVVLATKGGVRKTETGRTRDSSPEFLRAGVEQSLTNLGVEAIDLYQVHWPDPKTPFEETAGALKELVDEGKIKHVGVSNYDAAQMAAFGETLPVETLQPPYHLFRRTAEADILPYARENDIGVLVYGPLGHGLLTGALNASTTFSSDDWRSRHPAFKDDKFVANLAVVDELAKVATELEVTLTQLATAWTLANPAVQVAIIGTRNADHITDAIGAADVRLDADTLARIDAITAKGAQIGGSSPEGPTEP
ncbi:aldo/keto reductase [Fodinicola acaciae]|uniref:aldo/keto reductase n=1 Tax=Fodinicola acaciae TaxID=2681555 RepID=UPI0013D7544E|nr:aldo/keto reductase [Fodinicola acaciae]